MKLEILTSSSSAVPFPLMPAAELYLCTLTSDRQGASCRKETQSRGSLEVPIPQNMIPSLIPVFRRCANLRLLAVAHLLLLVRIQGNTSIIL